MRRRTAFELIFLLAFGVVLCMIAFYVLLSPARGEGPKLTWLLSTPVTIEDKAFTKVKVLRVYDGDTITVTLRAKLPTVFGEALGVRVFGVDTPEMHGKCDRERQLARAARDFVREKVAATKNVTLRHVSRGKYFRIVAAVDLDGEDLAGMLLERGYAVPYYGGTKTEDWCAS